MENQPEEQIQVVIPVPEEPKPIEEEKLPKNVVEEVDEKKFRLCRRSVGLTYSKSNLWKDEICKSLVASFKKKPNIVIVAKENHHGNGNVPPEVHFHVYLEWGEKQDIKNCRAFDIVDADGRIEHPNIRKVYNKLKWVQYITKEDQFPLVYGMSLSEFFKSKMTERALLCQDLITGELTLKDALLQYPQLLWDLEKIQNNLTIANAILKDNVVMNYVPQTKEKQRHFWVYGSTNTGKTTVLRNLMNANPDWWFQMPTNDDWVGYYKQPYLYMDEYKGQIQIQELNRICDGDAKVNVKRSSTQIIRWPIVIIVSNFDIASTYKNSDDKIIDTVRSRFKVICTDEPGWEKPLIDFFQLGGLPKKVPQINN